MREPQTQPPRWRLRVECGSCATKGANIVPLEIRPQAEAQPSTAARVQHPRARPLPIGTARRELPPSLGSRDVRYDDGKHSSSPCDACSVAAPNSLLTKAGPPGPPNRAPVYFDR